MWYSELKVLSLMSMYLLYTYSMFSLNSFLYSWVMMELGNLMVLMILKLTSPSEKDHMHPFAKDTMYIYFFYQSISAFVFLFMMYSEPVMPGVADTFFYIFMTIKMALFPTYQWMLMMVTELDPLVSTLILVVHKIPFLVMFLQLKTQAVMWLTMLNMAAGSLMMLATKSTSTLLVFSSIYGLIWYINSFLMGWPQMVLFSVGSMIFYSYCLKIWNGTLKDQYGIKVMSMMFLLGMPPFSIFFSKIGFSSMFYSHLSLMSMIIIWLFAVLSLIRYVSWGLSHVEGSNSESPSEEEESALLGLLVMFISSFFLFF